MTNAKTISPKAIDAMTNGGNESAELGTAGEPRKQETCTKIKLKFSASAYGEELQGEACMGRLLVK